MNRLLLFLLLLLLHSSCNKNYQTLNQSATAQNIILLIGDGMGLPQVSSTFYFQEETPNFVRFPFIGLHQPQPTDTRITDSAAGATAFSTGYKSYNAAIGVDGDTIPRETILEIAARRGMKTGVIATSSITHATPASFYAHVPDRNLHEAIAAQLADAPVDFFAGGGIQFFAQREDGVNYLNRLRSQSFTTDTVGLPSRINPDKKYGFLLAPDGMPRMQEGRGDFLPRATGLALEHLSESEQGFFLMVEGSQIDWGGHANDAKYVIEEMKDFDRTIQVALDFAERKGNTLVVVTADHETGGFALSAAEVRRRGDYRHIRPTFSTDGHTAALIPVFAYGPGAERFAGIYQNSDIFGKMMAAMGLKQDKGKRIRLEVTGR